MSARVKFQLASLSRSGIKVPGGVVVGWGGGVVVGWLRSILVFSLSLSQAEQIFAPEHNAHSLNAKKLRFHLKNHFFLPKARNSWVPNKVTQVQNLEPNQVTQSKSWNQTRLLDPNLVTKTGYSSYLIE